MAILGKTSITELDLIQPLSNENIANNFITINGTRVSLGGSVTTPNTDTSTTQSGHYTPSATASTVGATSGNNYIRGINLDSKKHVISVSTGTPTDTNTTYSAGSGLVLSNTTFSANGSAIINALGEGGSPATREDYIVAQYAGGGTTTTTYHRRKLANIFAALNKSDITTALGYTPPTTDTNTHYTTRLYAGASGTAAHSAVTNPYLKVTDDNTYRNQVRFVGGGATTITSDSAGTITITSTDTNTDSACTQDGHYTPSTSASTLGATSGNKYIRGIHLDSKKHVISVSTGTPTDTNTTYSIATNATAGLVKPLKHYSGSISTPSATSATTAPSVNAITTTSGRYYAVEMDAAGRMFVNVPWTDTDTNTNYYLTGVSGSGNGTVTFTRQGLSSLTWNASHTHSGYLTTIADSTFGSIYYGSQIIRPTSTSASNGCYLGNSSYKWNGVYTSYINGTAVPASPAFSDESCTKSGHYDPGLTASTAGSSSAYVKVIGLDGKGHVTGVTTGTPSFTETYKGTVTSVKVTGGTGLSSGGTITSSGTITINHAAATTATTLNTSGANYYITGLTMDGLGHVTGISQSYDDNTDSACTLGGHYTPSSSTTITAKTSGADYYVTGVTLNVDSKGHVTAMSVSSSVDDKGSSTSGSYLPLAGGTLTGGVTGTTMKLTGDLRLSGSSYYGRSIYFGDGSNAYISEPNDDELLVYGSTGVEIKNADWSVNLNDEGLLLDCYMTGSTIYAEAFYQLSDERLKDFCNEIEVDFNKLRALPKSYFTWKSDDTKTMQLGTSAQKVKELYPEIVSGTEENTLSVDYSKLSIVALKAIDVLHDENEKLKSIIEKMDERITQLEKKLGE